MFHKMLLFLSKVFLPSVNKNDCVCVCVLS